MKRTDPKPIGELFDQLFKSPNIAAKIAEGGLPNTWREVVGDSAADCTTQLRLENHILYAHISRSAIRSELFYRRDAIASEINRIAGLRLVNAVIIK